MEQHEYSICLNCFEARGTHGAHSSHSMRGAQIAHGAQIGHGSQIAHGALSPCPHCGYSAGSKPEQAYFLAPGAILCERYIIGTALGYGGFGVIYRVWDTLLNISAAIKEFYPIGLVSRSPGELNVAIYPGERRQHFRATLDRFLVEAKYMAKFNGEPNIVNVFDYFEANNTAYIVMEYLNGLSLKRYLEENGGRLSLETSLSILKPVIMGLAKIHANGILHRDISPENIVITADNQIKILDFGAARLGAASEPDDARNVVIKIGYAPPEQYRSHGEQGPYTDVYAVGATLYRMLTGATPEESVDREDIDNLARPSRLGIDLPPNVDRAIMKALALRPDIRFQSMGAMMAALYRSRRVAYPEDELAKRGRRRALSMASLGAVALAAAAAFACYMLIYVPGWTLDAARISPDSVTAWVASGLSEDDALCTALEAAAAQFCQDYPQFEVRVVRVPADRYYSDLKGALASEAGSGDSHPEPPPDLFYNGRGEAEFMEQAASFGKLLRQLDSGSYYFLDDYESLYPLGRVMPLGFDVAVVYANLALARDAGLDVPMAVESVSQFDAPKEFGGGDSYWHFATDVPRLADILYLFGGLRVDGGDAEFNGSGQAIIDTLAYSGASAPLGLAVSSDPFALFKEDRLAYLVADTSQYRFVQSSLMGYYGVIPLSYGGRMVGSFSGEFCVNAAASRNRQDLAMLFMQYSLHENTQNVMSIECRLAMPLNKEAFGRFTSTYGDLAFLERSVPDDIAILNGHARRAAYERLASALVDRLLS